MRDDHVFDTLPARFPPAHPWVGPPLAAFDPPNWRVGHPARGRPPDLECAWPPAEKQAGGRMAQPEGES